MSAPALPSHARVVIIGGGVIGTSVAYHLGELGCRDVVLLERDRLTSGTTWHAAGLIVTFGSTSATSTELRTYTRDLYARLEAETGQSTGFRPVGFIEVAGDRDRLEEYRRVAAFNRHCGIDVHELSPREVAERFPLARTDDLLAGFYVAEDGRANPVDITMALAKGARARGVTICEQVAVTGVRSARGAVTGVETTAGPITCEVVVNCAGIWARQLAERSGIAVPLQAAEHYYLLTEAIPGIHRDLPVLEDPSSYCYLREEGGGLLVGLFEPICAPWRVDGIPEDFSFGEIPPDWERMTPYLERALSRIPGAAEIGLKKLFCGPESFTPDLAPIVGEAPELTNYFVAAGLNSIGILTGGGIGRLLARWIVDDRPDLDVTGIHIDRFHPFQTTPEYRRLRTVESLGMVYQCHYPLRTMTSARGAKRSALHDRLAAQGARYREISGWEAADWYGEPRAPQGPPEAPEAPEAPEVLSWGRPPWFERWAAEHHACREGVVLMDMSFMAKFLVQGRDAGRVLSRLSTADVDGPCERVTYTQWLHPSGTLEADLTVTKLADDRLLVVASDTAHRHVLAWIHRHLGDAHAFVTDVTAGWTQINLQGPRSRALLQGLTTADLSDPAFPFRTAREIDLGLARVLCLRITYVGELGYELYVPSEQAAAVYDRLVAAGAAFELRHAGLRALSSLRMEKGYRDYGHDIDNTDGLIEVGLGFTAALGRPGGFLGEAAVAAAKAAGTPRRRLIQLLVSDPEPLMYHAEIVYRGGEAVGYIRAASYGHTLGGAVGLAMVDAGAGGVVDRAWLRGAPWEIDIAGVRYPARASLRPLYDPKMLRVRGL